MAPQTSLFQVYLRLRPPTQTPLPSQSSPWLIVEPPSTPAAQEPDERPQPFKSTHITLQPPNDSRKRAVERFGFTKVFQEEASQLDVFDEIGTVDSVKNLLVSGRDGLIATLGVTGSGKVRQLRTYFLGADRSVEPYHPRIQRATGPHTNDT